MPSSGPKLMVVRASRLAGACTLRAFTRLALPLPLRAKYTDAYKRQSACLAVMHAWHCIKSCGHGHGRRWAAAVEHDCVAAASSQSSIMQGRGRQLMQVCRQTCEEAFVADDETSSLFTAKIYPDEQRPSSQGCKSGFRLKNAVRTSAVLQHCCHCA